MSYSFNLTLQEKGGVRTQLQKASTVARKGQDDAGKEQLDAAVDVVEALVKSGKLGKGRFAVNVSGHANPEFKDRPGFAKETLNISISRVSDSE